MSNDLSARMKRFNVEHEHRHKESSRNFIREKCRRCKESGRSGILNGRLCGACRQELQEEPEEQWEWAQRIGWQNVR